MKKILFILFVTLFSGKLYSQVVPDGILFQAIAKDAGGNAANERTIYAIVSIIQGTPNGNVSYSETFQTTSAVDGIFSITIGQGTHVSGVNKLSDIDWKLTPYFINIKIAIAPTVPQPDWNINNSYVDIGTSQLWSSPFSFLSDRAIIADSTKAVTGLVLGGNGGTGVSNIGKTITLGGNLVTKGMGGLTLTTTAASNITLPTSGVIVARDSRDTLSNKTILSPDLIGAPTSVNPDRASNDNSIATTAFVKTGLNTLDSTFNLKTGSDIVGLKTKIAADSLLLATRIKNDSLLLSKTIVDSANALNGRLNTTNLLANTKLNAADTASLSNRINLNKQAIIDSAVSLNGRKLNASDTASLSGRININKQAIIDSAVALNGRKLNAADTASLSGRINNLVTLANTKVNIADTSAMLSPYFKSINDLNINKLNAADTTQILKMYAKKFSKDVPVKLSIGKSLGKYLNGDTVRATGMTLDDFLSDISTEAIHPMYSKPTVSLSASPSAGDYEMGSNLSLLLTPTFVQNDAGSILSTSYNNITTNTSLGGNSTTIASLTSPQTFGVTVQYGKGAPKNNNLNVSDSVGLINAGSVAASITFNPRYKRYWGVGDNSNITDLILLAQTNASELADNKTKSTFSISIPSGSNKFVYYAYPSSYGALNSLSVGGFESISAFTLISRNIVNAQGLTISYNIYVSNNNFTESISNIICN